MAKRKSETLARLEFGLAWEELRADAGASDLFKELDASRGSEAEMRAWALRWNLEADWIVAGLSAVRIRDGVCTPLHSLVLTVPLATEPPDWPVGWSPVSGETQDEAKRRLLREAKRAITAHRQAVESKHPEVQEAPNLLPARLALRWQALGASKYSLARRYYGETTKDAQREVARVITTYLRLIGLQPRTGS